MRKSMRLIYEILNDIGVLQYTVLHAEYFKPFIPTSKLFIQILMFVAIENEGS